MSKLILVTSNENIQITCPNMIKGRQLFIDNKVAIGFRSPRLLNYTTTGDNTKYNEQCLKHWKWVWVSYCVFPLENCKSTPAIVNV